MSAPRPALGLTVRVPLAMHLKLFSPASGDGHAPPNTAVHAFDLGLPGTLPVCSDHAIVLAVRIATALGAEVMPASRFVRRHARGPMWPRGYQLTQRAEPFARGGSVTTAAGSVLALHSLALEEGGAAVHDASPRARVDANGSGRALLCLRSEPCLRGSDEVRPALAALAERLHFEGVDGGPCSAPVVEASVALATATDATVGPIVALIDLPDPATAEQAVARELRRQLAIVAADGRITAEVRRWDPVRHDCMPIAPDSPGASQFWLDDPDLAPLRIDAALLAQERQRTAESPQHRRGRYDALGLAPTTVTALLADRATGDWFESLVATGTAPAIAAHWLVDGLLPLLHARGERLATTRRQPAPFAELVSLCVRTQRLGTAMQHAVQQWLDQPSPTITARALGLDRIDDDGALRQWLQSAIVARPDLAAAAARHDPAATQALLHHAQRLGRGRAAFDRLQRLLGTALADASRAAPP